MSDPWIIIVYNVIFREDKGEPNIEEFLEAIGPFNEYEQAERFAEENGLRNGDHEDFDLEEEGEARRCFFTCLRKEPHLSKK